MATAAHRPPSFFPPLEQILWGAAICGPAYVASRYEVASRWIHVILLTWHSINLVSIAWVVFVAPLFWSSRSQRHPSGLLRQITGAFLAAILIAGIASWYLIDHWFPNSNGTLFAVTAVSCGIAIIATGIASFIRKLMLPHKIDALVSQGKWQDALDLLLPLLKDAPFTSTNHALAATLYWRLNQQEQAQALFDDVLARGNRSPVVLEIVASGYYSLERYLEGLSLVDEALRADGTRKLELLLNRCHLLIALKQHDQAREQLQQIEQQFTATDLSVPHLQPGLSVIRAAIAAR